MADFNNAVMTTEGVSLLAKTAAGSARIKFTKLATGSGTYTETEKMVENLQVRTSLKEPKQEVPFSSISMVSATCIKLTAIISNETLISGYHVNEVGIFAVDEMDRDAEPILYSIAVANVADYLPPYNGLVISTISQEYYATVNNSSEVVIHTNLGAVALADDLNALKKEVRTNGKTFIASGGNFEIPELGINKEATLKELCEAMVTYRIDNNTNHVRVDWWINTASKIGNEVRDRLNFTYGNLNLICQNRTVYLTLKKYYDAENPAKVYICTYTKENNANSFSVWTTLEDMTKTVERLEKAIEDAEALRASPTVYGMTKITNSAAVTDSTGLALAATEKNATIGGTLANQLAQLNTDLQFIEYINVLQPIDIPIHFSVIFSVGKIRQLIIKCGAAQSGGEFNLTQIPAAHRPAHPVYAVPIIGVPDGSGDSYLLRASINENGMITIANYSNNFAIESYIDIFYFSV